MNIEPRWMTLEQAQQYCGLSVRALQNYIRDGLIKSANVTAPGSSRGRRLVETESLNNFIESHVGKPATQLKMNENR